MKKRKIRYDRILLPILILCVIIFGISSCHKTEETKVQSKPIHTTTDFLRNALKPVGQTLYIYGGGWNEAQTGSGTEALTLGLSKEWKSFYDTQDSSYNYENYMYEIHKGLDCSGYVGWTIYNTLETKSNHGNGYVLKAEEMTKTYANMKLGSYKDSIQNAKPGDIVSMANAHVYIVLAVCEDGSLLIAHSSPQVLKFQVHMTKMEIQIHKLSDMHKKSWKRIIQTGTVVIQIALSILVLLNHVMYLYFTGIQKH